MRGVFLLLCLGGATLAQDSFETALRHLTAARDSLLTTGTRAQMFPAVEKFAELEDPRCVRPLVELLVKTLQGEAELRGRIRKSEVGRGAAVQDMDRLDRELALLVRRVEAGARDLGPQVAERRAARQKAERSFLKARDEVARLYHQLGLVRELREKVTAGAIRVLGKVEGDEARKSLAVLDEMLGHPDASRSLFYIRLLRKSGLPGGAPRLITILNDPQRPLVARRRAIAALADLGEPEGLDALIALWEREPDGAGRQIRHVLSLAAKRQLESPEDARAWAKEKGR